MSKAIRCDRCKKCFDPYKVEGDFARITDFVVTDSKFYNSNECSYRDENIDLCPDCLKSWNRWLKNYSDPITTVDNYYNDIVVDKESLDEAMHIDELRYNLIDQINQLTMFANKAQSITEDGV